MISHINYLMLHYQELEILEEFQLILLMVEVTTH